MLAAVDREENDLRFPRIIPDGVVHGDWADKDPMGQAAGGGQVRVPI